MSWEGRYEEEVEVHDDDPRRNDGERREQIRVGAGKGVMVRVVS